MVQVVASPKLAHLASGGSSSAEQDSYDPQQLSLAGKINALVALGRIPLASEVPLWTMFGCIIASRTFTGSQ
jgi:hypothetical protein